MFCPYIFSLTAICNRRPEYFSPPSMESLPVELAVVILKMVASSSASSKPANPKRARNIYNERKQLLAPCTLLSRKWREIAQPYLFEDLRFTLSNRCLWAIFDFFSRSVRTRVSVRRLRLVDYSCLGNADGLVTTPANPRSELSIDLLTKTLRLFPHLLHIRLEDVLFTPFIDAELANVHNAGLVIDTLEIKRQSRNMNLEPQSFYGILSCFSHISKLRIEGADSTGDGSWTYRGTSVPQVLEIKLIDSRDAHDVLRVLKTPSIGACQLERLDIEHVSNSWTQFFPALQSVVDHLGSRLLHLRCNLVLRPGCCKCSNIGFGRRTITNIAWPVEQSDSSLPVQRIDLSGCTNLQSLTLGYQLPASKPRSSVILSTLLTTLVLLERQPTFPPLQALNLEVELLDGMDLDIREQLMALGMQAVEPLLLRLCNRAGLNGVVFRSPPYTDRLYSSAYRASLALCFPSLRSKGLLHYQERGSCSLADVEVL